MNYIIYTHTSVAVGCIYHIYTCSRACRYLPIHTYSWYLATFICYVQPWYMLYLYIRASVTCETRGESGTASIRVANIYVYYIGYTIPTYVGSYSVGLTRLKESLVYFYNTFEDYNIISCHVYNMYHAYTWCEYIITCLEII